MNTQVPLTQRWLQELLGERLLPEPLATCDDCAMLPAPGEAQEESHFNPKTKCCTYFPRLANFQIGRILADDNPALEEGRSRLRAVLAGGHDVTPLGLSLIDGRRSPEPLSDKNFGHDARLLCPYYVERAGFNCSIWPHRNGVCLCWACKHSRGKRGGRFRKTLEHLTVVVERELAIWCLLQLGCTEEVLAAALPHPQLPRDLLPSTGSPAPLADETLFRRCAELVEGLSWPDVARVGGAEVQGLEQLVRAAHRALCSTALPEHLVVGPLTIEAMGPETVRLVTYSLYDPVDLPAPLFAALRHFDGSPQAVVRKRIAEEGLELDDELLRSLVDCAILVPQG